MARVFEEIRIYDIDSKSKDKTKEAIKGLVSITPSKAIKLVNGEEIEITFDEDEKIYQRKDVDDFH